MKELLIFVCVLLINWCISKMMPEVENSKDYKINIAIQYVICCFITFVVLFRYYGSVKIILSFIVSLVVCGIVNMKDWIQLRKKKDLVF